MLEVLKALLGGPSPGEYALNVVSQVAQLLEISGNYKEATEAFTLLENKYKNHPDEAVAKQATARAENGRRRSALIGQPFTVDGVQADGSPFDWGKYQGKVVLVDFWATWCRPCLEEIPNIDANYKKYKAQGFEVVGVNLDDDPQTVVRFLEVQPLPWTTVVMLTRTPWASITRWPSNAASTRFRSSCCWTATAKSTRCTSGARNWTRSWRNCWVRRHAGSPRRSAGSPGRQARRRGARRLTASFVRSPHSRWSVRFSVWMAAGRARNSCRTDCQSVREIGGLDLAIPVLRSKP